MNQFLQNLIPHLANLNSIGYLIVFLAALIENIIILGYFTPGATIVLIFGILAGRGYYDFGDLLFFSIAGNIIGTTLSYLLGKKIGIKALNDGFLFIKPDHFQKVKIFFEKHGGKSILFGKMFPGIKENIPFVAGIIHIKFIYFLIYNSIGAIFWSLIFVGIGFFFSSSLVLAEIRVTRFVYVLIVGIIFLGIFLFVKFLFIKYGKIFLNLFLDLISYFKIKFLSNRYIKKISIKYPKITTFLSNRFENNNFLGLPLSILSFFIIYIIIEYSLFTDAVLDGSLITQIDIRLSDFFYYFKDSRLINFFIFISYFGYNYFIILLSIVVSVFLYIRGKKVEILGLLTSIISSSIIAVIFKIVIHRERPILAVYLENGYSFPSFHAAISIALYGFILRLFFQKARKWKTKINIIFAGILIGFLIGLSRLYLNVHYLSDVISGWFLGALGLIFGITIVGYLKHFLRDNKTKTSDINRVFLYIIILFFLVIQPFLYNFYYNKITFTIEKGTVYTKVNNINDIFKNREHLKYTETITGRSTEPINFIFVAKNDEQLTNLFNVSGWNIADKLSKQSIENIGISLLDKAKYESAPITPLYWNSEIQNFGFQKLTNENTIKLRHHIRIWKTSYTIGDYFIYVGCGVYDDGLKWGITHRIDPNIDNEREYIYNTFLNNNLIENSEILQLEEAFEGKNFSGDDFFTDGKSYYIKIK
ncbi:MAG: LssY C-terminal domain-containing protein [Candidatus Gracilibacteria bacterium]|nr:LssY C-terminal domain-containing protein [Candidatus Gracilibacteria bacterium]